jgi:hypothetical protein
LRVARLQVRQHAADSDGPETLVGELEEVPPTLVGELEEVPPTLVGELEEVPPTLVRRSNVGTGAAPGLGTDVP